MVFSFLWLQLNSLTNPIGRSGILPPQEIDLSQMMEGRIHSSEGLNGLAKGNVGFSQFLP